MIHDSIVDRVAQGVQVWHDGSMIMSQALNDPTVPCCGRDTADCDCPKYTVLMHDGLGSNPWPEPPSAENGADTLTDARRLFASWMRDSGNDYTRAEGYGQPWADVVLTESWDGISYGDITGGDGVCRFERGPRGGITRENF